MDTREIICLRCPRGCGIHVQMENGEVSSLEGNVCRLGDEYARSEIKSPVRTLTTLVRVRNGVHPLVPVWTTKPVPKDKIIDISKLIQAISLDAPVPFEYPVLKNVLGLGIDVITSNEVKQNP